MNADQIVGFVNLFCGGILAGEEFVIRFGVRRPIASLDEGPQIELRQRLIRSLRILVPAVFVPTVLSGVAVTMLAGRGLGFGFRCAAVVALLIWTVTTLKGTVPINEATLEWEPKAPPANWRALVSRWELLDTVRTWAAITAFALFLTAMAVEATGY
jgi:uncharacterized membrane protein